MEVGWRAVNSRRDEMRRKSKAATGSVIAKTLNLVFLWYYSGDHKPWQMKNDKPDQDDAHIHGIYTLSLCSIHSRNIVQRRSSNKLETLSEIRSTLIYCTFISENALHLRPPVLVRR